MNSLRCFIWNTYVQFGIPSTEKNGMIFSSPRAGGKYFMTDMAEVQVESCEDQAKARLTSWLIEQRESGVDCPEITMSIVKQAKDRQPLPVTERISRLLKFLKLNSPTIGTRISIDDFGMGMMAWSESIKEEELYFLLQHLEKRDLVVLYPEEKETALTVDGYSHNG